MAEVAQFRAVAMPDGSVDIWQGPHWERLGALYDADDRWVMHFATEEPVILDVEDIEALTGFIKSVLSEGVETHG